jgi:hypothetical protein
MRENQLRIRPSLRNTRFEVGGRDQDVNRADLVSFFSGICMIICLILLAHDNMQRLPPQLNSMLQSSQLGHSTNQARILTFNPHFLFDLDIDVTIGKDIFSFVMCMRSWTGSEGMCKPVAEAEASQ